MYARRINSKGPNNIELGEGREESGAGPVEACKQLAEVARRERIGERKFWFCCGIFSG